MLGCLVTAGWGDGGRVLTPSPGSASSPAGKAGSTSRTLPLHAHLDPKSPPDAAPVQRDASCRLPGTRHDCYCSTVAATQVWRPQAGEFSEMGENHISKVAGRTGMLLSKAALQEQRGDKMSRKSRNLCPSHLQSSFPPLPDPPTAPHISADSSCGQTASD